MFPYTTFDYNSPHNHKYCEIMKELSKEVQDRIFQVAGNRMTNNADYSDRNILLKTLGDNFVNLRYPFSRYENMHEDEYEEYSIAWHELGSPEKEAEFIYYPLELEGLIFALFQEVLTWLQENPEDKELKPPESK